jgi:hypothetical protein
MGSLMEADKRTAKRKGFVAGAAAAGSVVLLVAHAPILAVVGLVGTGYLAVDWFKYRAKRGMRF